MGKFAAIKIGSIFTAGGEKFRKTSDLNYESLETPGYEHFINPLFEGKIDQPEGKPVTDISAKFITDPNTRVTQLNPGFIENAAEAAFGEMWGSAEFDCGPQDYIFMAEQSIEAMRLLNAQNMKKLKSTATKKKAAKKAVAKKKSKSKR
jgi:hypothetical protein